MKAKGVKELNKYKIGDKLTNRQTIIAKCADCMGLYVDGKLDCTILDCPLYPLMPYGSIWKGRRKGKIPVGFINTIRRKQKGAKLSPSQLVDTDSMPLGAHHKSPSTFGAGAGSESVTS